MKRLRANLLLLLTAMIWGAAFVAQSVSMDYIGPFTFLCSRSLLGGVVLLPVIAVMGKGKKQSAEQKPGNRKLLLIGGICCGVMLFIGSAFQQIGIQYTTAGKAGFITAMYMVLVPICGLFFGKRPSGKTWGAVVVALAGMYLLCLYGSGIESLSRGDLLEMLCALGFTAHILVIDYFSPKVDGVKMSCILSSGVGYTLQIVAQKDTQPTVASLLMSLESVFSLIFGWILLKESMSGVELLGCGLMFAAIVWVQLPGKKKAAA